MFWNRLNLLCSERNIKLTNLVKELGMSTGNQSKWKHGTIPKADVLQRFSDYFDVSVDYLLGKTDVKEKPTTETGDGLSQEFKSLYCQLTPEQKEIVLGAMREFVKAK